MAGYEDGPKTKRFIALVEARAKKKQIPFRLALSEIAQEHPKLANDYSREISGWPRANAAAQGPIQNVDIHIVASGGWFDATFSQNMKHHSLNRPQIDRIIAILLEGAAQTPANEKPQTSTTEVCAT